MFRNSRVDSRFDFFLLGNNFRNSNVNAFIGLLDFDRIHEHIKKRYEISVLFCNELDKSKYYTPESNNILFCLPIILKENPNGENLNKIKNYCDKNSIEYRPIISGFLGYQTPYKKYNLNPQHYPNSLLLHENGIYVGLHSKLKKEDVKKLVSFLNSI